MMGARVPEACRAEYEYNKVFNDFKTIVRLVGFYSLLSSLNARNHEPEIEKTTSS
jgi:hypothetical protein